MFQLIENICKNPDDNTKMHLIFANQSESDILLREELEEFQKNYPDKLKIWYTISKSILPGLLIFTFNVKLGESSLTHTFLLNTHKKSVLIAK